MGIKYNPALDGLRAVAVLAVIEYHGDWHWLGLAGNVGVEVFFVLSGFLITSILLREEARGGIDLKAFYLRRARRLYPALCVLVGLLYLCGWVGGQGALNVLLYLVDYLPTPGSLAHTWTLAVEEHYYLLWPVALPLFARMERQRAVVVLLTIYALSLWWAEAHVIAWRDGFRFDTHMHGLVLGSMLAFLPVTSRLPFVLLVLASVATMLGYQNPRPFAEAATACLILLSYRTTIPFLTRAPLVCLGKISYGIYLYHWPLQGAIKLAGLEGWQLLVVTIAASIACAALSYHTVEAWFRSRNDPVLQPAVEPEVVVASR